MAVDNLLAGLAGEPMPSVVGAQFLPPSPRIKATAPSGRFSLEKFEL